MREEGRGLPVEVNIPLVLASGYQSVTAETGTINLNSFLFSLPCF